MNNIKRLCHGVANRAHADILDPRFPRFPDSQQPEPGPTISARPTMPADLQGMEKIMNTHVDRRSIFATAAAVAGGAVAAGAAATGTATLVAPAAAETSPEDHRSFDERLAELAEHSPDLAERLQAQMHVLLDEAIDRHFLPRTSNAVRARYYTAQCTLRIIRERWIGASKRSRAAAARLAAIG